MVALSLFRGKERGGLFINQRWTLSLQMTQFYIAHFRLCEVFDGNAGKCQYRICIIGNSLLVYYSNMFNENELALQTTYYHGTLVEWGHRYFHQPKRERLWFEFCHPLLSTAWWNASQRPAPQIPDETRQFRNWQLAFAERWAVAHLDKRNIVHKEEEWGG